MPASGPYRSRLFNVLHRQTRQWVDQSTQVWRHVKVATLWSVQLLLYPVYWVFQTGRVVGKQLQQAERQVAHFRLQLEARRQQHPPLTADTAIHNVLQAIQALVPTTNFPTAEPLVPLSAPPEAAPSLPESIAHPADRAASPPENRPEPNPIAPSLSAASVSIPSPVSPTITARIATPVNPPTAPTSPLATSPTRSAPVLQPNAIRAIASWVDTRTLVLVTAQNQVLDILTPQQQQWLYQRLADEVAYYRRYQPIAQTPHWQLQVRLFPPKLRPTQFPPVRYFRALMAWMQQGPVAKLTNLFDEATLLTNDRWDLANLLTVPALPTLADIDPSGQPTAPPALPPPPSWLGTLPQSATTLIQQLLQQEAAQTTEPVTAIAVDLQWEGPADLWASALPLLPEHGISGSPASIPSPRQGIPCPFPPSLPEVPPAALPPSAVTSAQPVRSPAFLQSALRALNREATHSSAVNSGGAVAPVDPRGVGQPVPVSQWQAIVRLIRANPTGGLTSEQAHLSPITPASGTPIRPSHRVSPASPATPASAVSPLIPPLIPPPTPAGPLQAATAAVSPVPGSTTETAPTAMGKGFPTELSPAATEVAPVPAPPLLEVEAQIIGYVKHPLEHVLEWLDHIMLWLETIVGRMWRWLQAHLPQL